MTLAQWIQKRRASRALAAAERAMRAGRTARAAARFADAAAHADGNPALLHDIRKAAGEQLLDAAAPREASAYLLVAAEDAPTETDTLFRLARAAFMIDDEVLEIFAWRGVLKNNLACMKAHRRLAKLLYRADPKAARPHLKAVAAAAPEWTENWRRLARVQARFGDAEGETAAWRRVLDRAPDDCEAHSRLADLTWRETDPAAAHAHLEVLAEAPPEDGAFWERLARARAAAGERDGEVAAWRRYLRASQYGFVAHRSLGAHYLEKKFPQEARVHLTAAAALGPGKKTVLQMLAKACRASGDRAGEIEALSKLSTQAPNDARVARRLGGLFVQNAQYAQAVSAFRLAAKNGADGVDLRQRTAKALEAAGADAPTIIDAWRSVLALDADNTSAHERLAHHLTACRQWEEAVPHLRKTAEANPDAAGVRRALARALDVAGETPERIAAWREVLALDEDDPDIHRRLADLIEPTDPVVAREHLEFLTTVAPGEIDLWRRLARAHQAAGDAEGEACAQLKIIDLHKEDMEAHRRLAEIYSAAGEAKETARHLSAWVRAHGRDQAAWEKLARVREEIGDSDGALDAWRRASSLGALEAGANAHAGALFHAAKRYEEAIGYFRAALEMRPDDAPVLRQLARVCQAAVMPGEEIDLWRRVLSAQPDDPTAHRRLGDLFFGLKDHAQAAPHLMRASDDAPDNSRLARRLAKTCRATGDEESEIGAWRRIAGLQPDNKEAHRRLGDLLFGLKRHAQAAPHLKYASDAEPSDAQLARRLAKACRKVGDADGERLALARLIAGAPDEIAAHRRLSTLLEAQGDAEQAASYLEFVIAAKPGQVSLRRKMAVLRRRLQDADAEIAALKALIDLEPENGKAQARCGAVLFERRVFSDAAPHLLAAAHAAPNDKTVRVKLARCYKKTGNVAREVRTLEDILALDDDDLAVRRRLAALLTKLGRPDDALNHLRLCAKAAPDNEADLRALAEALSTKPDLRDEAAAAWARLVKLAPHDRQARLRLADAHLAAGRNKAAGLLYKALVADAPDDADLWRKWTQAARALRGAKGEATILRSAIKATPNAGAFRYALSALLIERGQDEGVEMMHAAWEAHPDPEKFASLCAKLVEQNRTDLAAAEYAMLSREAPQSFAGWLGLGEIMLRMERHRLAATYLGRAYELSGEKAHRELWLDSLLKSGAFKIAAENCEALLESDEEDASAQIRLAEAFAGMKRFKDAHAIMETFYEPADMLEKEALLDYLDTRAGAKSARNPESEPVSPLEALFQKAERCQARGDLRGAAGLYRKDGAALRRHFVQSAKDDAEVAGPDFMIIGAPFCGAARIERMLKRHPQLRVAEGRPGYFTSKSHYSVAAYVKRFARIDPASGATDVSIPVRRARKIKQKAPIFGDAAPDCLTMPDEAIELAASLYPELRLICAVGDPIARAWLHLKHRRLAARSPDFYCGTDGKIADWMEAVLECGRYERHLKRWVRWFAPEQFLIIDATSLEADPESVFNVIQKFIGAETIDLSSIGRKTKNPPQAVAEDAPTKDIARFLTQAYGGEIFNAKMLRRALDPAPLAPDARAKAA